MSRGAVTTLVAIALGAAPAGAAHGKASDACWSDVPQAGVGAVDPFRPPAAKAVELNAAAKVPYRQGKWEEARAQYRAAAAADPEFLAPTLNVACSFVRQERFAEAATEVVALLNRAYVPWVREVAEAADLGALKVLPEGKRIQRAQVAAAARWGEGLDASVLFVARQRPPLHVPDGAGVFLLNPHQEVWAFTPRTRRYRQLTATDGHVVAFARASDGRRILYVSAEKLVRGARPDDVALRGVAVRALTLATMSLGPAAPIDGDVRRLDIATDLSLDITTEHARGLFRLDDAGPLVPAGFGGKRAATLVTLTGDGVAPETKARPLGSCTVAARDRIEKGRAPAIEVSRSPTGPWTLLNTPSGAGLRGLSIPR